MIRFTAFVLSLAGRLLCPCALILLATGCAASSNNRKGEDVFQMASELAPGVVEVWQSKGEDSSYDLETSTFYIRGIYAGRGRQGHEKVLDYLKENPPTPTVISWKSADGDAYSDPREAAFFVNGISVGRGAEGWNKVRGCLNGLPEACFVLFAPAGIRLDEPIALQSLQETLGFPVTDERLPGGPGNSKYLFFSLNVAEDLADPKWNADKCGAREDVAYEAAAAVNRLRAFHFVPQGFEDSWEGIRPRQADGKKRQSPEP